MTGNGLPQAEAHSAPAPAATEDLVAILADSQPKVINNGQQPEVIVAADVLEAPAAPELVATDVAAPSAEVAAPAPRRNRILDRLDRVDGKRAALLAVTASLGLGAVAPGIAAAENANTLNASSTAPASATNPNSTTSPSSTAPGDSKTGAGASSALPSNTNETGDDASSATPSGTETDPDASAVTPQVPTQEEINKKLADALASGDISKKEAKELGALLKKVNEANDQAEQAKNMPTPQDIQTIRDLADLTGDDTISGDKFTPGVKALLEKDVAASKDTNNSDPTKLSEHDAKFIEDTITSIEDISTISVTGDQITDDMAINLYTLADTAEHDATLAVLEAQKPTKDDVKSLEDLAKASGSPDSGLTGANVTPYVKALLQKEVDESADADNQDKDKLSEGDAEQVQTNLIDAAGDDSVAIEGSSITPDMAKNFSNLAKSLEKKLKAKETDPNAGSTSGDLKDAADAKTVPWAAKRAYKAVHSGNVTFMEAMKSMAKKKDSDKLDNDKHSVSSMRQVDKHPEKASKANTRLLALGLVDSIASKTAEGTAMANATYNAIHGITGYELPSGKKQESVRDTILKQATSEHTKFQIKHPGSKEHPITRMNTLNIDGSDHLRDAGKIVLDGSTAVLSMTLKNGTEVWYKCENGCLNLLLVIPPAPVAAPAPQTPPTHGIGGPTPTHEIPPTITVDQPKGGPAPAPKPRIRPKPQPKPEDKKPEDKPKEERLPMKDTDGSKPGAGRPNDSDPLAANGGQESQDTQAGLGPQNDPTVTAPTTSEPQQPTSVTTGAPDAQEGQGPTDAPQQPTPNTEGGHGHTDPDED